MTTLSSPGIATHWSAIASAVADDIEDASSSIATTMASQPSAKWGDCINALLGAWRDATRDQHRDPDAPTRETIEAAMQWLQHLQNESPQQPPRSVIPEPGGGLIIDWQDQTSDGVEIISELTLYNDRTAEGTHYTNGRVCKMVEVPFFPPANVGQ